MLTGIEDISSISLLLEEQFCVSITDHNGIITYVNQRFCDLSKYKKEELIGKNFGLLNPEYTPKKFTLEMNHAFAKNNVRQQQVKIFTKHGSPYWVYLTILPVHDEDGSITQFISLDIDVTTKMTTNEAYQQTIEGLFNVENALNQSSVVVVTDPKGVITYVNEKFCELSKYTREELVGQTHQIVNSGFHPKSFFQDMWRTIGNGGIWKGEIKNRAKDRSEYWVDTTIVPLLDKNDKPYQFIAIRTDVTAKKATEQSLEIALKNDFRQTVKNLQNAIFKYTADEEGKIIFTLLEGKTVEELGITIENVITNQLDHTYSEEECIKLDRYLRNSLHGDAVQFELGFLHYTFLIYLSPIFENNKVIEVVGTATDITNHKEAEKLVEHMAFYDHLTGLPNRRIFQRKVNEVIERSDKEDAFAIMFIDLDRFKNINDSMGHSIGDQLLITVGERLRQCVRKGDIVARLGGDEYVILLPSTQASVTEAVATRIVEEMSKPFIIHNHEVFVSSSIGISLFPEDGGDYDTLMTNADSAMYVVKDNGKNNYQFFTEELRHDMFEKTMLEMELRQALQKNQFEVHYQPQIDLKTGKLTGLEALIRWQHPSIGTISPTRFIPIAEEIGLIVPIGQWVLETACKQAKKWQNNGVPPINISVNVSIHQFKQNFFVEQVKETLANTGLQPIFLNLEITESMTSDQQNCEITLHQLRDLGVSVSIDDFGTGYSSLSCLSKLPITHLKIDRAFIQELNHSNKAIVKTIIILAKNLNITVIAEGVETKEQNHFLQKLHCDEAQGYLYSKPLPKDQIEALINGDSFNGIQ